MSNPGPQQQQLTATRDQASAATAAAVVGPNTLTSPANLSHGHTLDPDTLALTKLATSISACERHTIYGGLAVLGITIGIGVFNLASAATGTALLVLPALAAVRIYLNFGDQLSDPRKAPTDFERQVASANNFAISGSILGNACSGLLFSAAILLGLNTVVGQALFAGGVVLLSAAVFAAPFLARELLGGAYLSTLPKR